MSALWRIHPRVHVINENLSGFMQKLEEIDGEILHVSAQEENRRDLEKQKSIQRFKDQRKHHIFSYTLGQIYA
jgi:hypothetical protein